MHVASTRLPSLRAGDLVGDYCIEATIQRGGMGTVYAAVHPLIGKRVAIKVLHDELANDPSIVSRFMQEARAVNCISHPNVIDVFGFGSDASGRVFLVMELLKGATLMERMEASRLSIAEACQIGIDLAHALEATHAHGIVHRDLKPENIFLLSNGRDERPLVKLLDFGIAKDTTSPSQTSPGLLLGTPKYIAPEQARGCTVDHRADIYALGVVLFEMLTGRAPFVAELQVDLLVAHVAQLPPLASSLVPGLPVIADVLLAEMLHKRPEQRPSLPRVRDLLELLRVTVATQPQPSKDSWEHDATAIVDRLPPPPTVALPRRSRAGMLAGVLVATLIGALGFASWVSSQTAGIASASPVAQFPVEPVPLSGSEPEPIEASTFVPMALPEAPAKRVAKQAPKAKQLAPVVTPKRPLNHRGSAARSIAGRP